MAAQCPWATQRRSLNNAHEVEVEVQGVGRAGAGAPEMQRKQWKEGRGPLGILGLLTPASGLDPAGQAPPAMVCRRWTCS